jgi:hypothetical protein
LGQQASSRDISAGRCRRWYREPTCGSRSIVNQKAFACSRALTLQAAPTAQRAKAVLNEPFAARVTFRVSVW